jgi:hypothetical protein
MALNAELNPLDASGNHTGEFRQETPMNVQDDSLEKAGRCHLN